MPPVSVPLTVPVSARAPAARQSLSRWLWRPRVLARVELLLFSVTDSNSLYEIDIIVTSNLNRVSLSAVTAKPAASL